MSVEVRLYHYWIVCWCMPFVLLSEYFGKIIEQNSLFSKKKNGIAKFA
jgi:hypothetical protein